MVLPPGCGSKCPMELARNADFLSTSTTVFLPQQLQNQQAPEHVYVFYKLLNDSDVNCWLGASHPGLFISCVPDAKSRKAVS